MSRLGRERFLIVTGHRVRPPRPIVDRAARPGRRLGHGPRRHRRDGVPRAVGTAGPRRPRRRVRRRPVVPVHAGRQVTVGDVPCWALARDVRRRARLGAVPERRVRARAVGHVDRGRAAARPRPRRVPGHRLAAAGEGLPGVGHRHHLGDRPVLGRARASPSAPTSDFIGRDALPCGRRRAGPAGVPRARRRALGRPRQRTGAHAERRGRRTGDQRRAGVHRRRVDRLRLGAGRAARPIGTDARPSRCSARSSPRPSPPSRASTRPAPASGPDRSVPSGRPIATRCGVATACRARGRRARARWPAAPPACPGPSGR